MYSKMYCVMHYLNIYQIHYLYCYLNKVTICSPKGHIMTYNFVYLSPVSIMLHTQCKIGKYQYNNVFSLNQPSNTSKSAELQTNILIVTPSRKLEVWRNISAVLKCLMYLQIIWWQPCGCYYVCFKHFVICCHNL